MKSHSSLQVIQGKSVPERAQPSEELNKKIVQLLQQDGRLPFKDIALKLAVSEGTIRNRVQWMKDAGLLKIVALAEPMEVNYRADAMVGIKVARGVRPSQVAQRLSEFSEVVYIVWVSGRYDLLVEVVCESEELFRTFMETECFGHEDIAQFEIMTAIENYKNQFLLKRQLV